MTRLYILLCSFILAGALCRSQHNPQSADNGVIGSWDRDRLQAHLEVLTEQPHPMGSERQLKLAA